MATSLGKATTLEVSSDGGTTWIPVGKTITVSRRGEQADDEKIYVLNDAVPITQAGDDEGTVDITWLRDAADAGQTAIRTAKSDGTALGTRIKWDGTAGETRDYTVPSITTDSDPNGTGVNRFVRESVTLTSAGAVTPVP